MELVALISILIALQYLYLTILVGKSRSETGISAPACTGDPKFERVFRVQQNTVEQLIILYPALWIFGYYVHAQAAAALGLVFLLGRIVYARGYVKDPGKRGPGFLIGSLALLTLLIGDLLMLVMKGL
ncbi:MAG: MAPEG family protein [Halieaceae bacterium]|nr:MAPEG family protein [Halieaceae bacterium]